MAPPVERGGGWKGRHSSGEDPWLVEEPAQAALGVGRGAVEGGQEPLREERGITGAAEVELVTADGRVELTVPDAPARVEERDARRWSGPSRQGCAGERSTTR